MSLPELVALPPLGSSLFDMLDALVGMSVAGSRLFDSGRLFSGARLLSDVGLFTSVERCLEMRTSIDNRWIEYLALSKPTACRW